MLEPPLGCSAGTAAEGAHPCGPGSQTELCSLFCLPRGDFHQGLLPEMLLRGRDFVWPCSCLKNSEHVEAPEAGTTPAPGSVQRVSRAGCPPADRHTPKIKI